MRLDLYFIGMVICTTIIYWIGWKKDNWTTNRETKSKFNTIYIIGLIAMFLGMITSSANAYQWCNQTGYDYCIEQTGNINGTNITSKIAMNIYDDTGEMYDEFAYKGHAIKGLYAEIYYEGQQLYYISNLTSWDEACINGTQKINEIPCKGTYLTQLIPEQNNVIEIGKLYDEYKECPIFISVKCEAGICEWAGTGYIKPENNTCSHIKVIECYYDEDCLTNQYCDKNNLHDYTTWTCKELSTNQTRNNSITNNDVPTGYTGTNTEEKKGYQATYTANDVPKSLIDLIIKIILSMGNLFSGGK